MMNFVLKNEEVCIKNEEHCIKNDEFCSRCKALVSLSVHDNHLQALPQMPAKLTELLLHNNPIMLEFSTAEIRALFSAVTVEESVNNDISHAEESGEVTREGLCVCLNI